MLNWGNREEDGWGGAMDRTGNQQRAVIKNGGKEAQKNAVRKRGTLPCLGTKADGALSHPSP